MWIANLSQCRSLDLAAGLKKSYYKPIHLENVCYYRRRCRAGLTWRTNSLRDSQSYCCSKLVCSFSDHEFSASSCIIHTIELAKAVLCVCVSDIMLARLNIDRMHHITHVTQAIDRLPTCRTRFNSDNASLYFERSGRLLQRCLVLALLRQYWMIDSDHFIF